MPISIAECRPKCTICNTEILKKRYWKKPKHTYCSIECRKAGAFLYPFNKKKGQYFNCIQCDALFYRQKSMIDKGENKFCSIKCYLENQKGRSKNSGFKLKPLLGSNNKNWKGGITNENRKIRTSVAYKEWRKAVFERDKYTCQCCGAKSKKGNNVYLEAHHKKPFSLYPHLRLDVNNGETLCESCHNTKPKGKQVCLLA